MSNADFTDILSKPVHSVEKPKPKPPGTYLGSIVGQPEQRTVTTKDGDKPVISFKVKLLQAQADVDQEKLSEVDTVTSWPPMSHDIWVEGEQGQYNLRRFLADVLKIDPGSSKDGKTLGQMCAEAPGKQLLVTVVNKPYMSKEGTPEIGTNIGGTAAV